MITYGKDLTVYDWVGSRGSDVVGELVDRRSELVIYGYVTDAEADYSYDDRALVSLEDRYYLLNTSGCSCRSPTETWGIVFGPATLDEVATYILDHPGYGVTKRQHREFIDLIITARLENMK